VNVTIPCPCPAKPDGAARHEQDTVTLMDTLPFRQHLILANTIPQLYREDPEAGVPEVVAALVEAYIVNCITTWTLVDDKGKAVPVTKADIRSRLLTHFEAATIVGNAGDDLYSERVTAPLLARASTSSQPTQTDALTSAPSGPGTTPQKPSKRSSTTSSLTVVTGSTASSPSGGSNSLPSSASAA